LKYWPSSPSLAAKIVATASSITMILILRLEDLEGHFPLILPGSWPTM
jgi:hypothetical protein